MQILRPICVDVFIVQKRYYYIQNITIKQFFLAYFTLKEKFKKGLIFDQNHGLTSLEKMQILRPFYIHVLQSRRAIIVSRRSLNRLFSAFLPNVTKQFFLEYFALKEKLKKCPILDQNHGLAPLEKCKCFDLFVLMFLQSRKAIILSRTPVNSFSRHILPKKKS